MSGESAGLEPADLEGLGTVEVGGVAVGGEEQRGAGDTLRADADEDQPPKRRLPARAESQAFLRLLGARDLSFAGRRRKPFRPPKRRPPAVPAAVGLGVEYRQPRPRTAVTGTRAAPVGLGFGPIRRRAHARIGWAQRLRGGGRARQEIAGPRRAPQTQCPPRGPPRGAGQSLPILSAGGVRLGRAERRPSASPSRRNR